MTSILFESRDKLLWKILLNLGFWHFLVITLRLGIIGRTTAKVILCLHGYFLERSLIRSKGKTFNFYISTSLMVSTKNLLSCKSSLSKECLRSAALSPEVSAHWAAAAQGRWGKTSRKPPLHPLCNLGIFTAESAIDVTFLTSPRYVPPLDLTHHNAGQASVISSLTQTAHLLLPGLLPSTLSLSKMFSKLHLFWSFVNPIATHCA